MKYLRSICKVFIVVLILITFSGCGKEIKEKVSAKNDKNISLGSWNENTYENDFLNIKYTLPENWSRYSDEEIAEVMKLGSEYLNDKQKLMQKLSELTTVTYMMSSDPTTGNNVILMSEKILLKDADINYYIDSVKKQLSLVETIKYDVTDEEEVNINGVKYHSVTLSADYGSVKLNQRYYVRKNGKYFISIIATSNTGIDSLNDIVKPFEKLN